MTPDQHNEAPEHMHFRAEVHRLKTLHAKELSLAWSDGYSTRMRHESEMADNPGYRISWRDGIKQNPHRDDQ